MGLHLCSLRNLSSFYDSLNSSPGILTESDFSLSYSSPCQPKESDLSLACHFQNRSPDYYVRIPGGISQPHPVLSGVPQGTVLGHLLFFIMIINIDKGISSSSNLVSFADDT